MMRRSAGMGGGRMLRAMGRAVTGGDGGGAAKEKMAAAVGSGARVSKPACVVAVSPSSPPSLVASTSRSSISSCCLDAEEWEKVGEEFEEEEYLERFVFGPAPSREEVEEAVSTMQHIFVPITFPQDSEVDYPYLGEDLNASSSDWIEPALHLQNLKSSRSYNQEKVLNAFRSLQVDPALQKMVVSLSCDKSVWDAVMNNEMVQEYKKTLDQAQSTHSSEKGSDNHTGPLRWIFESTKGKLVDFFDKITKIVNDLFHSDEKNKDSDMYVDVVKSSFMLSVVVLIIVVLTRGQQA